MRIFCGALLISAFVSVLAFTGCGPRAADFATPCHTQLNAGDYEAAIASCSKALAIDTGYTEALKDRCIAYARLERFDPALHDCADAVRIAPSADAYSAQCLAMDIAKQYDAALAACNSAVAADSSNGYAYGKRCEVRSDMGAMIR